MTIIKNPLTVVMQGGGGDEELIKSMINYSTTEPTNPNPYTFRMDNDVTSTPLYCQYMNKNSVEFYFGTGITTIGNYSFYKTNFTFPNLMSMPNLFSIGQYAFTESNVGTFDFEHMPASLDTIEQRAFQDTLKTGQNITFPSNFKTFGNYAFASTLGKVFCGTLTIPGLRYYTTNTHTFENIAFNCDFNPPTRNLSTIGINFNYNGNFNNVTIPTNVTNVDHYSFGADSTDPTAEHNMCSFTFLATRPPTIGRDFLAVQNLKPGFKIYVPDSGIDRYKAVTNLANYVDYIVGESTRGTFTITLNLTNCTGDNDATSIQHGYTYKNKITPNTGYTLTGASVSIMMDNTELSNSSYCDGHYLYYSDGVITLPTLTANLTITITAVPEQ